MQICMKGTEEELTDHAAQNAGSLLATAAASRAPEAKESAAVSEAASTAACEKEEPASSSPNPLARAPRVP